MKHNMYVRSELIGGAHMATSSIFSNIKINDPKDAEAFIHALEASEKDPKIESTAPAIPTVTDLNAIRNLMSKRIKSNEE